jgi:hypothetical protein
VSEQPRTVRRPALGDVITTPQATTLEPCRTCRGRLTPNGEPCTRCTPP